MTTTLALLLACSNLSSESGVPDGTPPDFGHPVEDEITSLDSVIRYGVLTWDVDQTVPEAMRVSLVAAAQLWTDTSRGTTRLLELDDSSANITFSCEDASSKDMSAQDFGRITLAGHYPRLRVTIGDGSCEAANRRVAVHAMGHSLGFGHFTGFGVMDPTGSLNYSGIEHRWQFYDREAEVIGALYDRIRLHAANSAKHADAM